MYFVRAYLSRRTDKALRRSASVHCLACLPPRAMGTARGSGYKYHARAKGIELISDSLWRLEVISRVRPARASQEGLRRLPIGRHTGYTSGLINPRSLRNGGRSMLRGSTGGPHRGRRANWGRRAAVVAIVIAAIELITFLPGGLMPDPERPSTIDSTSIAQASPGGALASSQLADAQSSLATGAGPAGGTPLNCSASSARVASVLCGSAPISGKAKAPLTTSPSWTQVTYPSPVGREFPTLVYDTHDGYVLLFGGLGSSGALSDTWKFSGGVWTQLHPVKSPSARYGQAMAYDAADGYVLLFGGTTRTAALSDTWKFSAGVWSKLTPATSPGALLDASMTYDAKDGYVVLFGGSTPTSNAVGSTWKFVGGAWTKLAPTTNPADRFDASMDYDAKDGYVVLFGGFNATTVTLNDTWSFTAGDWTQLTPSTHPSARAGSSMAYSGLDGELVLFGGYTGSGYVSDTWTFVGATWTKVTPAAHPSSRSGFVMADGRQPRT
jgi:hypothetical protein